MKIQPERNRVRPGAKPDEHLEDRHRHNVGSREFAADEVRLLGQYAFQTIQTVGRECCCSSHSSEVFGSFTVR